MMWSKFPRPIASYDDGLNSNKRPGKWLRDVVASRCGRPGDVTVDQGHPSNISSFLHPQSAPIMTWQIPAPSCYSRLPSVQGHSPPKPPNHVVWYRALTGDSPWQKGGTSFSFCLPGNDKVDPVHPGWCPCCPALARSMKSHGKRWLVLPTPHGCSFPLPQAKISPALVSPSPGLGPSPFLLPLPLFCTLQLQIFERFSSLYSSSH